MPDKEMQEARQRLARYRANVNRINSLLRLPLRLRGPSQSVTVKPRDNPGGGTSKNYPDALSDLQRLADINTMIAGYVLEITEIEGALSVLGKEESLVLIMRDVDEMAISAIGEALGYSSRQAIYNIYKRALNKFKIALG